MSKNQEQTEDLVLVPLDEIDRPQVIDRIEIDKGEVESLAKSIQEQTLLQPPILRPKGDRWEIIAGDRRILALKLLERKQVSCVIRRISDKATAEIRATENLQRINLTVIEEAKIYANLHQNHGLSLDQIGRRMGISAGLVKRRMDLLKMPDCLQRAMHKKQISYGVAEALWSITEEAALDYYLGFAVDHGVTVTIARQWASDWKATQRRIEQTNQDPVEALSSPVIRPTYLACDLCNNPSLVEDLTVLRVCRGCAQELALAKMKK